MFGNIHDTPYSIDDRVAHGVCLLQFQFYSTAEINVLKDLIHNRLKGAPQAVVSAKLRKLRLVPTKTGCSTLVFTVAKHCLHSELLTLTLVVVLTANSVNTKSKSFEFVWLRFPAYASVVVWDVVVQHYYLNILTYPDSDRPSTSTCSSSFADAIMLLKRFWRKTRA